MKKIIIGAMIILTVGVMSGCKEENKDSTSTKTTSTVEEEMSTVVSFDINEMSDSLLANGSFKDKLAEVSNEIALSRLYVIDSAKVSEAIFYTNSNATAEEIAIIKVNDGETTADIISAYNKRIEEQKVACESYLPDEMPKLENAVVIEKGAYAILVISEDSSKATEIINNYIGK